MESFSSYGSLSKKKSEDLIDGARIKPESYKRNPKDFVYGNPHLMILQDGIVLGDTVGQVGISNVQV